MSCSSVEIKKTVTKAFAVLVAVFSTSAHADHVYDVIVRGGTIYDGSGKEPFVADVAIDGDSIAGIGNAENEGPKS